MSDPKLDILKSVSSQLTWSHVWVTICEEEVNVAFAEYTVACKSIHLPWTFSHFDHKFKLILLGFYVIDLWS